MEKSEVAGKLLSKSGEVDSSVLADVPVILYYFSGEWCYYCIEFTPKLVAFYNELNKETKQVEVVFISHDHTEKDFEAYYKKMPWLAISYGDTRISALKAKFSPPFIPKLYVVDKDGNLLMDHARRWIEEDGIKAYDTFLRKYKY